MNISPNFALEEFEPDGPMPTECRPPYIELANEILEPAREFAQGKLRITSGYRPAEANAAAHGQPNSEHMATADFGAADFIGLGTKNVREIFDWMRTNPSLPFHQLILEHGANGSVIHVSYNRLKPGLRSVLEGATHNAEAYTPVDHVAFVRKDDPGASLGADESTQV